MATALKLRRGTTAGNNAFTGAEGEVTYDTQRKTLRTHDGSTAGGVELATASMAARKNVIINGGFTVNQRVYASSAVLASGNYGHDRWKAGASGGDYSFTQLAHNTTITIASGKTLIQVIEDKNVVGGTYVLSWTGTAQARAGVDSATPSGSYAASPLTITGQTAGTVMSVEFNTGTLGKVQLEAGSVATEFEYRTFQDELALCQRYYAKTFPYATAPAQAAGSSGAIYWLSPSTATGGAMWHFPVTMRATPTLTTYNPSAANALWRNGTGGVDVAVAIGTNSAGDKSAAINTNASTTAANEHYIHVAASAEL